jgi:peptidoglycan/xylan/chitin deacetylase (PgdA/CDA1 family)
MAFIINLHGVGVPPRACEIDEQPYWITREKFNELIEFAAQPKYRARVGLTFDDGNLSDYAIAAPELRRRGLRASFYVLAGRIGQHGYLSKTQVCELSTEGFEIGSHGLDHVVWTKASDTALTREIGDSRAILEDLTGRVVCSVAIPFGLYDRRVLWEIRRHGYQNVFSSDGGPRLTVAPPIPRYTVRRDVDLATLARLMHKSGGFLARTWTEARVRVKASLDRGAAP